MNKLVGRVKKGFHRIYDTSFRSLNEINDIILKV